MLCQKGRDGGRATLPPGPAGAGLCGSPAGRERGCSGVGGSLRRRQRGAPSPGAAAEGRAEYQGPAAPPGAGKGPGLQPGGGRGRRGLRGARRVAVRARGPGRGAGAGAGVGEAHGEVSPPRRTVFCGRNSLERRQWSGMFTAGGKTISNSSGEMCHPNVTGKLT